MLCLGRQRELARLGDAAGRGRSLVVAGPPGIGKSTLLAAARDELGPRARLGVCLERLADRPYLPLLHAAGEVGTPADDAAAARMVLRALGDDGVLLLDDLQWADPATVRVALHLVGRRSVLAAVRAGAPGADALRRRLVEAGAGELALDGLDEEALLRVAASRRPDLGDGERRRLVRAAAGVPLHLLASLEDEDAEPRARLRARVRRLGPDAHRALALLALAGRPLPPGVAGDAVDRLLADGLAERVGGAVRPAHDLIGRAAVELLPEAERRALHAELAEGARDDGDAAVHWQEAGEPERAVATALAAADAAGGVLERARLLAVAATNATGPQARCLRLRACRALAEAGDAVAAAGLLRAVEADAEGVAPAELALTRAAVAWAAADHAATHAACDAGLANLEGASPAIELELLLLRAQIPIWAWDVEAATVWTGRAQVLSERLGARRGRVRMTLAQVAYIRLDPACVELAGEARDIALAEGDAATAAEWPSFASGALDAYEPEVDGLLRGLAAIDREAERLDLRRGAVASDALRIGRRALLRGERSAVRELEDLLELPLDGRLREQVEAELALALAALGRTDQARRLLAAEHPRTPHGDAVWRLARAETHYAEGRLRDAAELAARATPDAPLGAELRLVGAWAAFDDGDTIPELFASLGPPPYRRAADGATAAMRLLATRGPSPPVVVAFGAAATAAARSSAFDGLRCAWAAGEVARRGAEDERARALLERAEDEADRLGFEPLLARVRASLRRLGLRRHETRGPVRGLTGREREVLECVAAGLRTPEIAARLGVGATTVESFVRRATRKLGARTRVQAAAIALAAERPAEAASARRGCASSIRVRSAALPHGQAAGVRSLRRARDVDEAVLAAARGSDLVVAVEPGELRDAALDALGRVAVVETDGEMLLGPVAELEPEGRRMLELLASGVTIADAAEALHISRRTADRVLARARQSLGARTTAQAVRMLGEVGGRGDPARRGRSDEPGVDP